LFSLCAGFVRVVAAASLVAAALAGLSGAGGVATAQGTAQKWEVQAGLLDEHTGAEVMAYGPDPLIIRAGDTVTWSMVGPFGVMFNAGKPDLPPIVPGPGQGELMLGPGVMPVGATGTVTDFDGTKQVGSGLALEGPLTFSLRFPKPGLYGYVNPLLPVMRGEVIVLDASAALPETPAAAKARGQATLGALAGKAVSAAGHATTVHQALSTGNPTVFVGVHDPYGASIDAFIGGNKTVRRGDDVTFAFGDPVIPHTVTFLSGATPPGFVEPRPQPAGPPQLVIAANVAGPAGGNTYTGTGYLNSGILEAPGAFTVRFDAPPGSYAYLCVIHPFMQGTITVTG
jgi:plastocyanin